MKIFYNRFAKKTIVPVIFSGMMYLLILTGCSKKSDPVPVDPGPDSTSYSAILIDSLRTIPLSHIRIYLVQTISGFSGPWWDPTWYYSVINLDSFYTDSSGGFSFTLNRSEKLNIASLSLFYDLPEIYMEEPYLGSNIKSMEKGTTIYAQAAAFVRVDFKNFRGNNSCDYYFLDMLNTKDSTLYSNLKTWSYGEPTHIIDVKKYKPNKYLLHARYACGASKNEQWVDIDLKPFDTLTLSTVIHK